MKVNKKRLLAVLCSIIMICNSGMGIVAHAQENMETLIWGPYQELSGDNIGHGIFDIPNNSGAKAAILTDCTIGISVGADGVKGSITTGSTETASKIGVENVKVEKYVDGKWTLVGSSSGGYKTNSSSYAASVSTSSAEPNIYYRISCTHYAYLNGVKHELNNVTNGVKYP